MAELDPTAIPDLNLLSTQVLKILEFIETCEFKNDASRLRIAIIDKFIDTPVQIIRILTNDESDEKRRDSVIRMFEYFERLQSVKDGADNINRCYDQFREEMATEYIYPNFGGKEQFEKTIKENAEKRNEK